MRYRIIKKLGEGNRGEVFLAELEDSTKVAIKWFKNYSIDKEWEILNFLNGYIAPKPLFRGNRYIVMELIDGFSLKYFLNSTIYYDILKESLIQAYNLDMKGVSHNQLGRYYHIFLYNNVIRFIDFERGSFSNPRNVLQIVGYYLFRDNNFDKDYLKYAINIYKKNKRQGLEFLLRSFDESKN